MKDKLRLDFEHFFKDRQTIKTNINILVNSKRHYVNIKVENNKFFQDTAEVFKAIPLRRITKCKRLIKSLELKSFSLLQIEDIFDWMGDSLESFRISNMPETNVFKSDRKIPSKLNEKYSKKFSSLKVLSLKKVSREFQKFFKYFVNVTNLSLNCVTLDQLKCSLQCCANVRALHLGDIYCNQIDIKDLDVLQNLLHLREIIVGSDYCKAFYDLFVGTICNQEVKHLFSLKVFHLYDYIINEEYIKALISKFTCLEDILIDKFNGDSAIPVLKEVSNLKNLKSLRGTILNIKNFPISFNFLDISIQYLTTIEIYGKDALAPLGFEGSVENVLQRLPNLETLYLSNLKYNIEVLFGSLSKIEKLKTLILNRVYNINSDFEEFRPRIYYRSRISNNQSYSLKMDTLETLHIKNSSGTFACLNFKLPKLKKISISESRYSCHCLLSSIRDSRNLESIRIGNLTNFLLTDEIREISQLEHLKDLSLNIRDSDFLLEFVKCVMESTNLIHQLISLNCIESISIPSLKEFEKKLIEMVGYPLKAGKFER